MQHSTESLITVVLILACHTGVAHELLDANVRVVVDWEAPNISRVLSSGYGDSFGIEAAVKMGPPTIETVDGHTCVNGSYFLFDVADEFAFDIDETVELEILFDRRRSTGFWLGYDRNATSESAETIEFDTSHGHWHTQKVQLQRARFANRGEAGSDFALAGLSAMWPGTPDEHHRIVICDIRIDRSGDTVEPSEFGQLRLRVGSDTAETTPARIGIYDATGRMPLPGDDALLIRNYERLSRQIFLCATHGTISPWLHTNRHVFYIDGRYGARLPAGEYRLVASKGPEYEVVSQDFLIESGKTTTVEITLARWIDMPAAGWYSGDDHVHMTRDEGDNEPISQVMRGEDVHVTNVLQMGNPAGTYFHQYAFGDAGRYLRGNNALVPGVEDPRTALRGHTISLNISEVVRDSDIYLRYDKIFDAYREQGGLSGYAHVAGELFNVDRGLALDVPLGSVDFVEVMQDGILATELWYDFLNLGFKLIPTAGSDFPYLGQPGSERNYVYVGETFSIEAWNEQLKANHTFVTNGPMLQLKVNGQRMGSTIELRSGDEIEISAAVSLNRDFESLDRLELIIHGEIVAHSHDVSSDNSIALDYSLTAGKGIWISARAYGIDQAAAHTAPVYVVVDGDGFRNEGAVAGIVDAMLARLDEFEDLQVNAADELEVWTVEQALMAMFADQHRHILQRVHEARKVYAAIADR
ncbi:MAG: CehA/McbA family metallohydrolase [Woeseiaceae bacterium]